LIEIKFTNKALLENIFHKKSFILEDEALSDNKLIKIYLNKFWDEIMVTLEKKQVVLLLFRVRFGDENDITKFGSYATLGKMFKVNNSKNDFNNLYEHLKALLSIKDQSYTNMPLDEIVFNYKIIGKDNKKISLKPTINKIIKPKAQTYKFRGYNLPNTMDLKLWGTIITKSDQNIIIKKKASQYIYNVKILNEPLTYNVTLELVNKETFLSFTDVINTDFNSLNSFTRYIGSNEYYFVDNNLELRLNPRRTSFLERINLFKNKLGKVNLPMLDEKFLTLDIETQVINGIINPILISIYDGVNHYNFYLPDYSSISEMIYKALSILLDPKYNNHKVYVHNLSNFDGIFLMKYLVNLTYDNVPILIKPTLKNSKMINIDLKFGKFKISFRDSLLILLGSLKNLSIAFGVESKGTFNYKSVDNLNVTELNEYALRNELIIYASLDCKILYEILIKFNELIFNRWNLNINNYPTLPSLAMGLFRSKFLNKDQVCVIKGKSFNDIKESYTGGSVDMIVAHGYNIYHYDVNSLYPYVMKNNNMPINNMKFFEGDINILKSDKVFGFFFVEIETPRNLNIPILQIHNKNGTISPLGKFTGWFFSEELYNASDLFGYKFKILKGYTFDKANIFNSYVNELYALRLTYDKANPMNYIAKILMNSLYGRFGLNPLLPETNIIDKEMLEDFVDQGEISELIELGDKYLISFLSNNKVDSFLNGSSIEDVKSNIAIASAITSYSRIHLAEIKKYCFDNNIKLFYFDTDSVFVDRPLPEHLIGKSIGQWKLEATIKEAVFIAPKVYGYIDIEGNEIVKCKGYKNKLTFTELKSLLILDNKLELPQEKWYSSLEKGNIEIFKQFYTLKVTQNKRNLVYNKNKIFYNTFPFYITQKI
jgi:DNA polymerase type B, organellar and viral